MTPGRGTLRARLLRVMMGLIGAFLIMDALLYYRIASLGQVLDQYFLAGRQMHLLHQTYNAARLFSVVTPDGALIAELQRDLDEDMEIAHTLTAAERELVRLVDYALQKPDEYADQVRQRLSAIEDAHERYDLLLRRMEVDYRQGARGVLILQVTILLALPIVLALSPLLALRDVVAGINRLKAKMSAGRSSGDSRVVEMTRDDEIGELGKAMDETFLALQKRQAESQAARHLLAEQQRMADLVNLTAGIAHEIGNPVAVLLASLDSVEMDPESLGERLAGMREAIQRLDVLLRQFTAFSGPGEEMAEPIDVNGVVEGALAMVRLDERLRRVRFETKGLADIPAVTFQKSALALCLFSLISSVANLIHNRPGCLAVATELAKDGVAIAVCATSDDAAGRSSGEAERFVTLPLGEGQAVIRSIGRLLGSYGAALTVDRLDAAERRVTVWLPSVAAAPRSAAAS